jgi:hypothetical protein
MPRATLLTALLTACAVAVAASSARVGRADAPAGRYTVSSDTGIVLDTKTGLTWTQAASNTELTEVGAVAYCGSLTTAGGGWRLPSVGELETLIDETRYNPAIDMTAFPATPTSDFYWSQSGYENFLGFGWAVSFLYGIATVYMQAGQNGWVRCVRP